MIIFTGGIYMRNKMVAFISALPIVFTNSLSVNAAMIEFKDNSDDNSENIEIVSEFKEDSQNISEDVAENLGVWEIYSDEFTKPERRLSEDFKSVMKVYNVPIRFAFSEFNNIDEVLKSEEILGTYYVVEHTDCSLDIYNDSLEKVSSNRLAEVDGKVTTILPIDISYRALEKFQDDSFIEKNISEDVELKNVYFLSGESCMMGTAIYYRTTAGDYVYYNHYDIGETIFPIDDFCKYQQAICDEIAKNPYADSGINISGVWDLSPYTINDNYSNSDDTPMATTTISDTTTAESSAAVITTALTSDTDNDETTPTSTTTTSDTTTVESSAAVITTALTSDTNNDETASTSITTNDTITFNNDDEELPQTGYSNIFRGIAGIAVFMTVTGTAIVVKTKKETE